MAYCMQIISLHKVLTNLYSMIKWEAKVHKPQEKTMGNPLAFIAVVLIGSIVAVFVDMALNVKFDKNTWWQQLGHKVIWMLQGAALAWVVTL